MASFQQIKQQNLFPSRSRKQKQTSFWCKYLPWLNQTLIIFISSQTVSWLLFNYFAIVGDTFGTISKRYSHPLRTVYDYTEIRSVNGIGKHVLPVLLNPSSITVKLYLSYVFQFYDIFYSCHAATSHDNNDTDGEIYFLRTYCKVSRF